METLSLKPVTRSSTAMSTQTQDQHLIIITLTDPLAEKEANMTGNIPLHKKEV